MNRIRVFQVAGAVSAVFISAASPPHVLGQECEGWVADYRGAEDESTAVRGVVVDEEGNVYVGGERYDGPNWDLLLIKYDRAGHQVWQRSYDGGAGLVDRFRGLAVDGDGDVLVIGTSESAKNEADYVTLKFDAEGNQLWVARYAEPMDDSPTDLAVGPDGSVVVTGSSRTEDTGRDYLTVKYDAEGVELWSRRYDGARSRSEEAVAVAVDDSGHVYVTGDADDEYVTIKYDSDGNRIWLRRYNGPKQLGGIASAMALGPEGNIHVTGWSANEYATLKYDPAGSLLWVALEQVGERAWAIAVGPGGTVHVTGHTSSDGGTSRRDIYTVSYDAAGNRMWTARYNNEDDGGDEARELEVDQVGNVFVAGSSRREGGASQPVVLKYEQDGALAWLTSHSDRGGAGDLAVDAAGRLYLAGYYWDDPVNVARTIRYSTLTHFAPSRFEVLRGVTQRGGLFSLIESDDDRLLVEARRPTSVSQPSVELVVMTTVPDTVIFKLTFGVEASVFIRGPQQWIDLYNFDEDRWQRVDTREATTNDSVTSVTIESDVAPFIDSQTRAMAARISFYDPGIPIAGWGARIDRTAWLLCLD